MNGPVFGWLNKASSIELEVLRAALVGGNDHAVHDALLGVVMKRRVEHHRIDVIGGAGPEIRVYLGGEIRPAGEDLRHLRDRGLIVGRDRQAVAAERERAVGLQLVQPDREKLHDLTRVIFVGARAGDGVGLGIAQRTEIVAHDRAQRDVLEQRAEIAEGAIAEDIVVVGEALRVSLAEAHVGDDHDFAQGEGDALAKLVGGGQHVFPPARPGDWPP